MDKSEFLGRVSLFKSFGHRERKEIQELFNRAELGQLLCDG